MKNKYKDNVSLKLKDPFHERESEKYENPIPSRELILELLSEAPQPMEFGHLCEALELPDEQQQALKKRLRAMERDGQLLFNRRRQYIPISRADLIAGRVIGHPDGFGFLQPDDGTDDLFIHAKQMRVLLHGDRILANVRGIDHKGRREAMVVEVLERATEQVVGRLLHEQGIYFVVPDNKRISQDIMIPPDEVGNAQTGQIVVAAIIKQPSKRSQPLGKVVEVLGDHLAPGMEIDVAIRSHELPFEWPQDVLDSINHFGFEVPEKAKEGRIDLRHIPLVTIDGEDAKDFDDAVYCEREGDHWRLLVAIADVSHYVEIGSALDKEATLRGTSVYFPGKVIPMLPEILSNGLCSLNPHVDRLCMVCDMRVDEQGHILSHDFFEAVMHSAARLTYNEVAEMVVQRSVEARNQHQTLVHHLDDLYDLYQAFRKARKERGAIDFETNETQIIFGKDRKIDQIIPTERNDAHKLIEECMIAANVCAAKFLERFRIPALHRCHDSPAPNKLGDVRDFLGSVGLSLGGGDEPEPADYAQVIERLWERPDRNLIQTVLLRSLSQAQYAPEAIGHFGLSQEYYAHFTSPIRRYPDLLVHRAIRHILRGGNAKDFQYSLSDMETLGEHTSMTERRAEDASRDVTAWLKCEYMQDRVGDTFDGIISAVTSFGLFVELRDIYVEGLIHVTALTNDYYHFDPVRHRLTGEASGIRFGLGEPIRVTVARVDLDERKIDFVLANREELEARKSKATPATTPSKAKKKRKTKSRKKKSKS